MHTRGTDAGAGAGDTTMKKNTAKSAVEQLYDSALLLDGYLADPHQMVARINDLLADASALHAK